MEAFLIQIDTGKVIWSNNGKQTQWLGLLGTVDRVVRTASSPALQVYSRALTKTLKGFPNLEKK